MVEDQRHLAELEGRLGRAGAKIESVADGILTSDPSGNGVLLSGNQPA
jgi:hypothetical protein